MRITRDAAISRLRRALAERTPAGQCTCRFAAEQNVLCGGFRRDDQTQLRMRYAAVIDVTGKRPAVEDRANTYQLRRAQEEGLAVSCDVQQHSYETCRGWDEFDNDDLARFCLQLLRQHVTVV